MIRVFFLLFSFLLIQIFSFGQVQNGTPKAQRFFNEAFAAYSSENLDRAIEYADKAIAEDPKFEKPYILKADIYTDARDFNKAEECYLNLLKENPQSYVGLVNIAKLYYSASKYNESLTYYGKVINLATIKDKQKAFFIQRIETIKSIVNLIEHPVPFTPINLGLNINTALNEYPPTLTIDGETMYFTRRLEKKPLTPEERKKPQNPAIFNEDIFESHLKNSEWQPSFKVPGELNTEDNEGAMAISPDGSFMLFAGCERPDGFGGCDLYISFKEENGWSKPSNIGAPVNTRFYETQPSISFDTRTIYFTSKRPGGYGGTDIWQTTRDDNFKFSEPVNLGPIINTPENEEVPFIHPDDKTLYFTSRGHGGLGGSDIFFSRKKSDGSWDSVQNIGYPINTKGDESGIVVDRLGKYAYYSSDNEKGLGGYDIYYFELPPNAKPQTATYLKGDVFDAISKEKIESIVEIGDVNARKIISRVNTNKEGDFLIPLAGGKEYFVNVSKKGYLFYSDNINLPLTGNTQTFEKKIPLQPLKSGSHIVLKNIFFDTDKSIIKPESFVELKKVIDLLNQNPGVKIEISGHTDSKGSPAHNKVLSLDRAKAIYTYLINTGKISTLRIKYVGDAELKPIASNNTEEGRAQNRRTEIKIL